MGVDTDTVDTVESVKPKLPQNHTTEAMVDTVMVDMVDTDTVDTVESVKPNHTTDMEDMEVMVDMVDTDMADTLMASKRPISKILPTYSSPTFNLESFTKIQDNMFWQLVITPESLQNLKFEESFDITAKK